MKKIAIQFYARNKRLAEHGITYQQYLSSPHWFSIREQLRQRPEYQQCYCCGSKKSIQMHHRRYKNIFSLKLHKHIQTIVALCASCHQEVHDLTQVTNHSLGSAVKKTKMKKERGQMFRDFHRLIGE